MRPKGKRNTRERILHSMYDLVAVHGYEKTAMSMICEDLDIKKPSIYHYFKSKEMMFISIFEEIVFADERLLFNFDVDKSGYKDELIRVGTDIIDNYENNPALVSVLMELYVQSRRIDTLGAKIKEYDEEYKQYTRDILRRGIELEIFDESFNIKENSELVLNTLQGAEFSIVFDFGLDNKRVWEKVIDSIFKENSDDK